MNQKHDIGSILGAYLTHTAKVADSEQEAITHFENCDWCQNWVKETKEADNIAFALQRIDGENGNK